MGILLGFLPFIAFAGIDAFWGTTYGLVAGALAAIGLLGRDIGLGKAPKILEAGTAILFCGLVLMTLAFAPGWSVWVVRLMVDAGLFAIVVISLLMGKPFTLQYAREMVDRSLWDNPAFFAVNRTITGVWALAFAAMVAADLLLAFVPSVPRWVGVAVTVAALAGAIRFTTWYPERAKG